MNRASNMTSVPFPQMERFREFQSAHPSKRLGAAGAAWSYISCGEGAQALFIFPGGLRVADSMYAHIEMFAGDYHVLVPTYPAVRRLDAVIHGAVAILDAEGVSQANLLGQSYGGLVCQAFLQRFPGRARRVVLSGTAPLISVRWKVQLIHLLLPLATALPERMLMRIFRRLLTPMITTQAEARTFWDSYLADLMGNRLKKPDILSHLHTTRDAYMLYAGSEGESGQWQGDVMVIWGEDDHLNTERGRHGMVSRYPQAKIRVLAGCGHTAALSKPDEYAEVVRRFLE